MSNLNQIRFGNASFSFSSCQAAEGTRCQWSLAAGAVREEAPGSRAGLCGAPGAGQGGRRGGAAGSGAGRLRGAAHGSGSAREARTALPPAGPSGRGNGSIGPRFSWEGKALLGFQSSLATADGMPLL